MGFYCFNRIFVGTYLFCPGMSREVLKNKDKRCSSGCGETNRLEWDGMPFIAEFPDAPGGNWLSSLGCLTLTREPCVSNPT